MNHGSYGCVRTCLFCAYAISKGDIEQASVCQWWFAVCSFSEHVYNEEMKGHNKITKETSWITQLDEMPLTTTHFPFRPYFKFPIYQHEDLDYRSLNQTLDKVGALKNLPHLMFGVSNRWRSLNLSNVISLLSVSGLEWPWPCLLPPLPLFVLFGWDPQSPVQLSTRSLMGTGGWGSSAFSSPLGIVLLADQQLLGHSPQWATPKQ